MSQRCCEFCYVHVVSSCPSPACMGESVGGWVDEYVCEREGEGSGWGG